MGILFKKGKLVKKVPSEELIDRLVEEVEIMANETDEETTASLASLPDFHEAMVLPGSEQEFPVLPSK